MGQKVVIVGGVAGGMSAAARLRRLDETADIVVLERGEAVSFANCGMPYHIGGVIPERSRLLVQTPESLRRRFRLDVRTLSEVVRVDPSRKIVEVRDLKSGRTYVEPYDALVLAPGAKPVVPPVPGIDAPHVMTLRNLRDMDRIREAATRPGVRRAVIVGGGFIGIEMAENFRRLGLETAIAEMADHVLPPLDPEMAAIIEKELTDHGVRLVLGDGLEAVRESEVVLRSGRTLPADLVVLAAGVRPDTDFLRDSGIALGERGHILVDEDMRTNVPDVYAVGDAVETFDAVHGGKAAVPLAGPANRQGRIAADRIAGWPSVYRGAVGTAIVRAFGLTAACTGANETALRRRGVPFRTVTVHANSHASYYPGAAPMALKLLFGDDGRVFGAQAVGADGVDKRIDVIATVVRLRGTVFDLADLELAYAPPYSSAKDPVHLAAYQAENVLRGLIDVCTYRDVQNRDAERTTLVDVRSPAEYAAGHIAGAVNIPVDDLRRRLGELDRDREIWTYCEVGFRGYIAARLLRQHGFRAKNLTGGFRTYRQATYVPESR
ncbi:MAG: CoA-disulfide reductase [Candidatus Reconcilbacillus cellulovorans]|uniref:CoA-disulfide reductase n=1 Tax=Candidatus Reconcilbacillus cellulovorans TaxID=1906605 RepID=A0A2A6DYJ2_9BACL|nr:MAG: CoA-disulfide reductase [Candidatus Reconcilbacillus cellulovorans]